LRTPLSSFRLLVWGITRLLRHGLPRQLVHTYVGIGDELLAASALRLAHAKGIDLRRTWFASRYPDLHAASKPPVRYLPWDARLFRLVRRLGRPVTYLHYENGPAGECSLPPTAHILAVFSRQLGVTGPIPLKPTLEIPAAATLQLGPFHLPEPARCIVVQSSATGAHIPIPAKNWPAENMQALVNALVARDLGRVIQIGLPIDPPLSGSLDLRGRLSLLQTAALLAQSRLFIGVAGGLMHLARAAECPAIIVYGGREPVGLAGYSANINLVDQPSCSPCYLTTPCPYGLPCMKAVTPAMVLAAVERQLGRNGSLPVECAEI
jgi:hypothetical protein